MDETNNQQHTANSVEQNEKEKNSLELTACINELVLLKDKYARLGSDFENYKRRIEKEKSSWMQSAQSAILTDLLTVADDFERALQAGKQNQQESSAALLAGFDLIEKGLQKLLAKYGVVPMKDYQTFDPEKHEALMHVDSPDHASGDIVQVLQKGFMHKDTVLRPAKVSVAK